MKKVKLIIVILVIGIIGIPIYFLSGHYNIGADDKHWALTEWMMSGVRDNAIKQASSAVEVPGNIKDPEYFVKGAGNYDAMCSGCHLAPGVNANELRAGLYPQPPDFTQFKFTDPARSFWVIKHGIKMSGMPAWGASHSDNEIWELVAFIHQLSGLDSKRYAVLVSAYSGSHTHADNHHDAKDGAETHTPHTDGHGHAH